MDYNFLEKYETEITKVLHDLEKIPEPSFKEYKTTEYIVNYFNKNGVKDIRVTEPGCFFHLDFGSSKTVALRADIDALPLDSSGENYKHICGHHLHTAALLFLVKILFDKKIRPKVNLRIIFQPAEENISGANFMIKKGAMEDVDEVFGIHVDPELDKGVVGLKTGNMMAGANFFDVTIKGDSTHAAYPHKGSDVVVAASDFVCRLQNIVSRKVDPIQNALVSVGKMQAGDIANVLPEKASLAGTFRFFDEEAAAVINDHLRLLAESISLFHNVYTYVDIHEGISPVHNDKFLSKEIGGRLNRVLEKLEFIDDDRLSLTGEDFACYQQMTPGIFFKIGTRTNQNNAPLHNRNFSLSDESAVDAVYFWLYLVSILE